MIVLCLSESVALAVRESFPDTFHRPLSHYFELPDSNWDYFPEFFRLALRVFAESLRMWPQVDHEIVFQ